MMSSFKSAIKPFLSNTYSQYCQYRFTSNGVALLCPPVPAENLGDQAMVLGAVRELCRRSIKEPILIKSGRDFSFEFPELSLCKLSSREAFFESEQAFQEECGLIRDLACSRDLLVFGADILDGHYGAKRFRRTFEAIKKAVQLNTRVRVIGFSISQAPNPESLEFFRHYSQQVELYPRDPVSLRRLRDAGVENLTLAADVAFLMDAADESQLSTDVRRFFDLHDGNVIGVGLHYNFFNNAPESRFAYLSQVLDRLGEAFESGIVFVPHHPADVTYFRHLESLSSDVMKARSLVLDKLPSAPIAKKIFADCRHVITSRMHVAIASLSSITPATCFPYFGKFEGLFEHFGLNEGLIYPDDFPTDPAVLAEQIAARIENDQASREQIAGELPRIVELAASNFDFRNSL